MKERLNVKNLIEVLEMSADYFLTIKDPKKRFNELGTLISCLLKIAYEDDKTIELKVRKGITFRVMDDYNKYLDALESKATDNLSRTIYH